MILFSNVRAENVFEINLSLNDYFRSSSGPQIDLSVIDVLTTNVFKSILIVTLLRFFDSVV